MLILLMAISSILTFYETIKFNERFDNIDYYNELFESENTDENLNTVNLPDFVHDPLIFDAHA